MDADIKRKLDDIQSQIDELRHNPVGVLTDPKSKDNIDVTLSERIHNTLWNSLFYVSSFATASVNSDDNNSNSTDPPMSSAMRESDTSAGKLFRPERESRFRCSFYLDGSTQDESDMYIVAPGTSQVTTIGSVINDSDKSYVGIKIYEGAVSLVSYNHNDGYEVVKATSKTITDATTHRLEIYYYITYAEVFFDNESLGTIPCKLTDDASFEVFFPFLTSVATSGLNATNLTIENYEFSQSRR